MNHWLETHRRMIGQVKRAIIEKGYLPQYQDFPLNEVEFLLNGSETEILRLQRELDAANKAYPKDKKPS